MQFLHEKTLCVCGCVCVNVCVRLFVSAQNVKRVKEEEISLQFVYVQIQFSDELGNA